MKLLFIFSFILTITPQRCQEENEENFENQYVDGFDYLAEDIKVRKAIAEWEKFIYESNAAVYSAQKQISQAADRAEDPHLRHRGKFKSLVIKAETQLESLSGKLLRADRFDIEDCDYDETTLQKMREFQVQVNNKIYKLNETLSELKSAEFNKP